MKINKKDKGLIQINQTITKKVFIFSCDLLSYFVYET